MRKMSAAARDELVTALARRYAVCTRAEKTRILDEFEAVTGFHRKHAIGLRYGQRHRVHQRDVARLLPGRGDRVHALPAVAQERPGLRRAEERRGGPAHRGLPPPRGPRGCGGAVAAVRDDEAVRQLLPAVVQAGVETAGRRARQQALPRAGDPEPAAPRRPEDACRRVRTRRRTGRHAGPDPAASADAGASAARRRHCRQAGRGAGGRDRPSARAVPRRLADRLGGRRSEADGQAACETEARAWTAGSVGQGHGTVACVVRSRAVEHRPPTARTPPGGASGRVPGRPSAHRAAAGQGLAQGKGDSDGVGELPVVESVADVE